MVERLISTVIDSRSSNSPWACQFPLPPIPMPSRLGMIFETNVRFCLRLRASTHLSPVGRLWWYSEPLPRNSRRRLWHCIFHPMSSSTQERQYRTAWDVFADDGDPGS